MAYLYDVFVSYASKDKDWAIRLRHDLEAKDLRVFRDADGLQAGLKWEKGLEDALEGSQHMVVLWTANAKSEWVSREITEFRARADSAEALQAYKERRSELLARERAPQLRRQIFLNLEKADHAFRSVQGIDDLVSGSVYKDGIDALTGDARQAWTDAVQRVDLAIRSADTRTPLPLAIVAMTAGECATLNEAQARATGTTLQQALAALGIGGLAALAASYPGARTDWRPFGGTQSVRAMLDVIIDRINVKVRHFLISNGMSAANAARHGYRWEFIEFIDPGLSETAVSSAVQRLSSGPSVVVIDPLSLYADDVFNRFRELEPCFKNAEGAIAALGPCGAAPFFTQLRDLTKRLTRPHLLPYFEPPIPGGDLALCGPTLQDEHELDRLIAFSLGRRATRPRSGASGYTRARKSR